MQNKKLIRFVESFVLMPIMTMGLPLGGLSDATLNLATNRVDAPQIVLSQKLNNKAEVSDASNSALDIEALTLEAKAEAIDSYFRSKGMPLAGTGKKMVEEAMENEIDWRLLPAIAVRESTGGKFACQKVTHSFFGWGGCKINFKSKEHAIEVVAWNLGGNNTKTARYYKDKTTLQKLERYNPRHIVATYPEQVIAIMDKIGDKDMGLELAFNNTK